MNLEIWWKNRTKGFLDLQISKFFPSFREKLEIYEKKQDIQRINALFSKIFLTWDCFLEIIWKSGVMERGGSHVSRPYGFFRYG